MSDGKQGVAYIQELRFAMYIQRLQGYIDRVIDSEFKRYLRAAGINVDPTIFHIKMNEPENFGIWRQQQLNSELLGTYTQAEGVQHLSKRLAQEKYLQMSQEDIIRNFRMRAEELGLDPDGDPKEVMLAVYGPPPGEAGGDLGGGGGMLAGTLGGPGFNAPMGGEEGDMGMGMGPETGNPAAPVAPENSGAMPPPQ
jgi:Bacteriophage T4-like portal protein (Gp20)